MPPGERRDVLSFTDFIRAVNPKYRFYPHAQVLIRVLQRVADGGLRRVMVFMPPRHGKSELVSRLFPAYYLHRHPDRFVGLSSYAAELAYTFSRNARDNYRRIGGTLKDGAAAVRQWETEAGGGLWAAGVGGAITGKGFHCFPVGTRIETECGTFPIEQVCSMSSPPRVLSFNHAKQRLEWRGIKAVAVQRARSFVQVRMASGRRIRCTPEHAFFSVEHGYRAACDLVPGETLIQVASLYDVRDVRNGDVSDRPLQGLLPQDQGRAVQGEVRSVRQGVSAPSLPSGEGHSAGALRLLLREGVQPGGSRDQESSHMQNVRWADGDQDEQILQDVSTESFTEAIATGNVPRVRYAVSAEVAPDGVLQPGVCEPGAFEAYERDWKQSLQRRHELREVVSEDASGDPGARRLLLHSVRQAGSQALFEPETERRFLSDTFDPARPPYRSGPLQQSSIQSCYAVQCVPQAASPARGQWETDTVSAVIGLCTGGEPVYDIQVEGNGNFFAEGILVHNCGIIDDPLKNASEAASETIRAKQWDWYDSTFYTREEPGAAIVIVQTRWHEDDLSGRLLAREREGASPEHWHVVNFEAVKSETPFEFPETCTVEEDGRKPGEPLCEERASRAKLEKVRTNSPSVWSALYQQRPSPPGGDLWRRDYFKPFDTLPEGTFGDGFDWDTAYTENERNAANAYVRSCTDREGNVYVTDVDWQWFEMPELIGWMKALGGPHYIERKASGKSAKQLLDRERIYAVEVEVQGDKVARTQDALPVGKAGKLYVKRSLMERLLDDEKQGVLRFPNGTHRDVNDALTQAIARHVTGGGWLIHGMD